MPVPACPAYESASEVRERLTALIVATLGGEPSERAQAEAAWPALIAALRRAENAGYDPADALTRTATARELRTASNLSEVLAWRINRHLAVHSANPADAGTMPNDTAMTTTHAPNTTTQRTILAVEQDASAREVAASGSVGIPLLPWVPGPRQDPTDGEAATLTVYLGGAAALITARVTDLADTAVRLRPPWTSALGQQPADFSRAREWRRHVGVIAAYRDQQKITTDDPWQILGPYAENGRAGHRAYWHAAESVLAARRLAGLEPANGASADDQARAQTAVDIYRGLPDDERAGIAAAIGTAAGTVWLGDPGGPDEHAAARPAYAPQLVTLLAARGHLTTGGEVLPPSQPDRLSEPLEGELARHGRPGPGRAERLHGTGPERAAQSNGGILQQVPPQPASPTSSRAPVR